MLYSVTRILDKLSFPVIARKEVYYHPLTDKTNVPGTCGDFHLAAKNGKILSSYINNNHAGSIYKL
mgnify:CR=1 FL=1